MDELMPGAVPPAKPASRRRITSLESRSREGRKVWIIAVARRAVWCGCGSALEFLTALTRE